VAAERKLRDVRELENVWIPMRDGTRIAARIWVPTDADSNPVPALVEYIPYRKRDGTRLGDETRHPWLAARGYACVRPDIRGSGDSDGPPQDEYVRQEQDDGVEIIAWIAKQPWCTGRVGLFGISWGGFSALQVAARRPAALKAIITHCSTDDRYTDDAHYLGGCIVADMFGWGAMHTLNGSRPPDPEIVGPGWREQWRKRLEALDFYVADWLDHPHRDAFWKHGSVDENYRDIQCAVYAVGGWVDAYNCAIPRLLAGLDAPRKGLIGPWGHQYPHQGNPGPAIDWLSEALRWWDHWLKNIDTGIMDEPMYRVWMQHTPAMLGATEIPGRWVAETAWPSARITPSRYFLNSGTIDREAAAETSRVLAPNQAVGFASGHWCPFNMNTELPGDQRTDDALSLTFDSAPLEETFEILGAPRIVLSLSVDRPVALVAVRLNELTPTGESRRVTYAVLNLCHRDGHESPAALEPGARYDIQIPLRDIAHRFAAGNRLRIAISTSCWPLVWPSPEPVTLTLHTGRSWLELPVRPARADDDRLPAFGAAVVPDITAKKEVLEPPPADLVAKTLSRDVGTAVQRITSAGDSGRVRIVSTGTVMNTRWQEVLEIDADDPATARLESTRSQTLSRPDWNVRTEAILKMELTRAEFVLNGALRTFENDQPFVTREWQRRIPRRLV
jgi:putative CocE/NonD family hydrolase